MSQSLELVSATLRQPSYLSCLASWDYPVRIMQNLDTGQSLLESYQTAYEESTAEILGYIHDDLVCHDPEWLGRVQKEFSDERVGVVGFFGATGHGSRDLYTSPYKLSNLGRSGCLSNLSNAEHHGKRFRGSCDVAVLDGMALFVRRGVLLGAGGWPLATPISYFCYDYWICCVARELGWRIRVVGCAVDHLGGKSTGLNPHLKADFDASHRYIYDHFKRVLPYEVQQ